MCRKNRMGSGGGQSVLTEEDGRESKVEVVEKDGGEDWQE